ncbi:MAG: 5' nucleotidase, NT5C type [Candidatus Micrarchaeales archaeon]
MAKKVIGVDIDGATADTMKILRRIMKDEFGVDMSKTQITRYSMPGITGIKREDEIYAWKKAWRGFRKIPLEEKKIPKIIKELRKNFEIHIVTGTSATPHQLISWLKLKNIEYDQIYHVEGQRNKIDADVDVMIDDSHNVAEMFALKGKRAILLQQPWNIYYGPINGVEIARSWSEIPMMVRDLHV